jgi:hypothetical protein
LFYFKTFLPILTNRKNFSIKTIIPNKNLSKIDLYPIGEILHNTTCLKLTSAGVPFVLAAFLGRDF